jgi:tRNA threonylcarbamoyladenosine biosynthesis protein TsaB
MSARLLLIDTCGETAGVAVCLGSDVMAAKELSRGGASAEIVAVVRGLLERVGWRLRELDAVGVVRGRGSFTGMRTGMAAAKGLCEAAGVRLIGVSRLEVLAEAAAMTTGMVALDAGRGQVYVRAVVSGREWLCGDAELLELMVTQSAGQLVVAEQRVEDRLAAGRPVVRPLHVIDSLDVVLRRLTEDAVVPNEFVDANYVRGEQDIYRKAGEPARIMATEA